MIKDYSKLTDRIYMQISPELSQEFHSMLIDMAVAFSRLYEIDNAKPSEAMKCLKFLKDETINDIACLKNSVTTKTLYQLYFANFDSIEQALNKAQENERVLEALKKHLHILPMSDGTDVIAIGCPADEDVIEPNDFGYDIIKEWLGKDKSE